MDILDFLKNYWLLILVALIVLVLLVRAMFKLAVLALVIGGVLVIGFGFTPIDVWNWGKSAANDVSSLYGETVKPLLEEELEGANYAVLPDGRFVVKTAHIEVNGNQNSDTVTIRYKEQEMQVDVSKLGKTIQDYIEMIQAQIPAE